MKEKPILFSGEMVRAILDGRKTMTRRVVKFNHKLWLNPLPHVEYARDGMPIWFDAPPSKSIRDSDYFDNGYPCPYGFAGSRLWVREAWQYFGGDEYLYQREQSNVAYAASFVDDCRLRSWQVTKWRPSIHMPRWASRLTLEITDVRVERLQSITEADAMAEGVEAVISQKRCGWTPHVLEFSLLWDKINGPGSWDANPWVWVISFKRVE